MHVLCALDAALRRGPQPVEASSVAAVARSIEPVLGVDSAEEAPARVADPPRSEPPQPEVIYIDSSEPEGTTRVDVSAPSFDVQIVGESKYQSELRLVDEDTETEDRVFLARLVPEPQNPYDSNAIRIDAISKRRIGGMTIGYLARDVAITYKDAAALLTAGKHIGVCWAKLTGGMHGKRNYGVVLALKQPHEVVEQLGGGSAVAPTGPITSSGRFL